MRKIRHGIAIFLVMALLFACMAGCGGEKGAVNKLLNNFEGACRSADADAILDCIIPTIANPVRNTLNLLGVGSLNSALESLMELVGLNDFDESNIAEVLSSIRLSPESHSFNSDNDECDALVEFSYTTDSGTVTNKYIFHCAKYADEWFIVSIG